MTLTVIPESDVFAPDRGISNREAVTPIIAVMAFSLPAKVTI